MKKNKKPSAAMALLTLTWENLNRATAAHSWERVNHGMMDQLKLAIAYGFPFDDGDFATIGEKFRPHHWLDRDRFYRLAITGGQEGKHVPSGDKILATPHNMSAVKAMEANGYPCWMLRGHRLFMGATLYWMEASHIEKLAKNKLHPSQFVNDAFAGLGVKVTSIDAHRVVLSHYGEEGNSRPTRILKITREMMDAQNLLLRPPAKKKARKEDECE